MGKYVCCCSPLGYADCHSKAVEVVWVCRYGKVLPKQQYELPSSDQEQRDKIIDDLGDI